MRVRAIGHTWEGGMHNWHIYTSPIMVRISMRVRARVWVRTCARVWVRVSLLIRVGFRVQVGWLEKVAHRSEPQFKNALSKGWG